jgi:dipeptidyl aminopeptidase
MSYILDVNAIEILPPDFDPSQRYPVLFRVYGGPGSQMASYKFQLDWHTFIASKLRYIIVMVCLFVHSLSLLLE